MSTRPYYKNTNKSEIRAPFDRGYNKACVDWKDYYDDKLVESLEEIRDFVSANYEVNEEFVEEMNDRIATIKAETMW